MKTLKCKNITKIYNVKKTGGSLKDLVKSMFNPSYEDVVSVNDVSFEISEGQCLGILGTNGSGKSTLTKMFTGLLEPTQGEIDVLGFIPSKRSRDFLKNIGVVFGHKSSLWWDLPLIESFKSHRLIYGVSQEDFDVRLKEASKAFDLEKVLDRPVKYLSLGERVKAEITANLLHAPSVLFLDEPTVGLDVVSKFELRKFVKKWVKEKGTIVVLTTHDMVDVEECCDRVVLLEKGINRYDGGYQQLKQDLIKYKILDAKPLERPLTEEECKSYIRKIQSISDLLKVVDSSSEHISLEVDKDLQLKDIFTKLNSEYDVDIHLRLPTLEESLRDYYLEANGERK